ncbi:CYTH domain-containing protein [Motiliproteus coralliicola]|uniref:CYTH domain-containing protein n=1 Tax=Motiliproteus coralliicola TaxID=2283196 RepID=A0A369WA85_9GAMM|nr:CYTH domain-containing protein [Motiliproteus coralliicola]RDE18732.1 CYTH domain-containing protein [Motiliproteus coralliicola]
MPSEIELKLIVPVDLQQAFAQLPLLQQYSDSVRQDSLLNCYFDTPDQQLNRHRVALRIRRIGERFIQTLKTRGSSQAGLHQRQEWEWDVAGEQLELDKLPAEALPQDIPLQQLGAAFNTDFQRTSWQLSYPYQGQTTKIELVLDQGQVIAAGRHDPISEIELELKQGETGALFELAEQLADQVPLRVSRISKAEKGYRLHSPDRARPVPPLPESSTVDGDPLVVGQLIERLQALLELFEFNADAQLLPQAQQCLQGLHRQLAEPQPPLGQLLLEQGKRLHSLLEVPYDWDNCQQWLHSRDLGVCLLRLSRWLFEQSQA